jgi:hypothetical protein
VLCCAHEAPQGIVREDADVAGATAQEGALLARLAQATGGTKTEIIKRAIALYDTALELKAQGSRLAGRGGKLVATIIL